MASHHHEKHSSIRFHLLLISVLILLRSSTSFTASVSHHHHHRCVDTLLEAASGNNNNSDCYCDYRWRLIIASSAFATAAAAPYFASTQMAQALQERNEALCNTGFFTNVGAWYCTDIGNIGDEGISKELSIEAMSTVDSLMSKFDINNGDFISNNDDGGTNNGNNQRLNAASSSSRNDVKDDTSNK